MIRDFSRCRRGWHGRRLRFHRGHHRLLQRASRIKLGSRKSARHQHEHLGCNTALLDGIIEPAPHLCDRAVALDVSAARLQPQRSECTLKYEGVAGNHAIVRVLAVRLSEQASDDFRGGASLRQYRTRSERLLAWPDAGVQLPADHLGDLGDGSPRHHSRPLPFQPRQITVERNKAQLLLKNRPGDDRLWWFKK